jgi:hypothetical protein
MQNKHYFHQLMNICYSAENRQKKIDRVPPQSSIESPRIHKYRKENFDPNPRRIAYRRRIYD